MLYLCACVLYIYILHVCVNMCIYVLCHIYHTRVIYSIFYIPSHGIRMGYVSGLWVIYSVKECK